jgi:hypothetical protein
MSARENCDVPPTSKAAFAFFPVSLQISRSVTFRFFAIRLIVRISISMLLMDIGQVEFMADEIRIEQNFQGGNGSVALRLPFAVRGSESSEFDPCSSPALLFCAAFTNDGAGRFVVTNTCETEWKCSHVR